MIRTIMRATVLLFLLCFPMNAFATLYNYSVNGQFEENGANYDVMGNMTISEVFIFHDEASQCHPYYGFNITQFSLNINGKNESFLFSQRCSVLLARDIC